MKKTTFSVLALSLVLSQTLNANLEQKFIEKHQIVGESNELKRIIVELEYDANRNQILQEINQFQDTQLRREFNNVMHGFSFEIPSKFISKISNIKGVKSVRESLTYTPLAYKSQVLTNSLIAKATYANRGEGMVISIVDTGIDPKHKDMSTIKAIDKVKLPVSPESSEFTLKVPYGYNFSDNSYNFKDDKDKTMHGMHVAGIAAASGEYDENNPNASVEGVAPEAQVLAMKVFTNSPNNKLAYDDDILAAIEKSVELKADIINLSLGSPNGFVDSENPVQKAINYAQSQGVLVVAAAGNDTTAFSEDDGTSVSKNNIEKDRNDFGIVGSPSIADGALSVASYENELILKNTGILKNGSTKLHTISFIPSAGEIDETERSVVFANIGEAADYDNLDVYNKFVLIERGKISFVDKVNNALNRGAKGVIIFNNKAGSVNMDLTGATAGLVIGISQDEGKKLVELIKNNANSTLTLNAKQEYVQSSDANTMSSFTSWGTTNTLDFKPEISGVGGNVLSTLNDNQYKYDSGTSMAAPHVSGASAIIYSQLKKDLPQIDNYALFTKKTIINTAKVLSNPNNIPYTPRRQGAGLIQTNAAIQNRVLATYESEDGESLGELRDFNGIKTFNVVLKNYGSEEVRFNINPNLVQTTKTVKNDTVYEIVEQQSQATLSSNISEIVLKPNEVKKVEFTLNAENIVDEYVEGFISFKSQTTSQPDLTFAYLGFAGDWNKESIFDPIYSEENKDTVDKVYGFTRLITQLGEVYVPAGISANSGSRAAYSYENASISPNADTAADVILPQLATLRNVSRLEFNILNSNKEVIRHLVDERNIAKTSVKRFKANVTANEQFLVPAYLNAKWDGTIYDVQTGNLKTVEDGTYYYQVKGYLRESDTPQILEYKVEVDTKKPIVEVQSISQEEAGLKVRFTVEDRLDLVYHYARLNTTGDEITAKKVENNIYEVLLPNRAINDDLVELVVKDAAYNETVLKVEQAKTARFESGSQKQLVEQENDKTVLSLKLRDKETTKVRVTYKNVVDENQIIIDEKEVVNQEVTLETTLPVEGRYTTVVEELKSDKVISKVQLDTVIYDYHAPEISNVKAMNDGQIQATIQDNVFVANELLYFINDELVTPTFSGNTISIKKENPTNGDKLVVAHSNQNQKGLNSFVILDYINVPSLPPGPPLPPPLPPIGGGSSKKLNLTFNNFLAVGIKDLQTIENPNGTVIEKDGKYYYVIKGFTNDIWSSIYIAGNEATIDTQKSEFFAEVEIKEGINTINVISKDYTNKVLFEGNVKIFFDKQLPILNWNQNLQFEVDQDKTYIVVDDRNKELLLSGTLQDQGFGYGLEINGDYVISKTDISKQLTYDVPFTKTIKANPNDIITVVVVDAVGNKQEFKYYIKTVKVYDDLDLTRKIVKPEYETVTVNDVIYNIPDGYKVEFSEDVTKLTVGTHKVHVVVTYPNQKKKSFEVEITLTENKKVSLIKQEVHIDGSFKEFGETNNLSVNVVTEVKEDVVEDIFDLQLINPINGEVTVTLPLDKKGFSEVYYIENGQKVVLNTTHNGSQVQFKTNKIVPFIVSYKKERISFTNNNVKVSTKDFVKDVSFKANLIQSDENYDLFELEFFDTSNQKLEVKSGEYHVTLPKKVGRKVVKVSYIGDKEESFEFTQDKTSVSFVTTHFSKYALTYEPVIKESLISTKAVDTSDNQNILVWISLLLSSIWILRQIKQK